MDGHIDAHLLHILYKSIRTHERAPGAEVETIRRINEPVAVMDAFLSLMPISMDPLAIEHRQAVLCYSTCK